MASALEHVFAMWAAEAGLALAVQVTGGLVHTAPSVVAPQLGTVIPFQLTAVKSSEARGAGAGVAVH